MAEPITKEQLIKSSQNAETLEQVVNGNNTSNVTSREGRIYPTLAKALYEVIQTGGFEPFLTEAALLASVPTLPKKAAKALDTRKIWYWNGSSWIDTGLSELDLAKTYTDQMSASPNILSDALNEYVAENINFGGWNWLAGTFPTITDSSAHIPTLNNKILRTNGTQIDKIWDLSKTAVKAGDTLTVSSLCYFDKAGGKFSVIFRDSNNANISSTSSDPLLQGINTPKLQVTVPINAARLLIRHIYNTSVTDGLIVEVAAYSASVGVAPASFVSAPMPLEYLNYKLTNGVVAPAVAQAKTYTDQEIATTKSLIKYDNLYPDPFFRMYTAGVTRTDNYPLFNESTAAWSVVDYAASPFAYKKAIFNIAPAKSRNTNVKLARLGLKAGDLVTFKAGVVLVDGGSFVAAAYIRKSDNTVIGTIGAQSYTFTTNEYKEVSYSITITQQMIDEGDYIQMRLNVNNTTFENGWYVLGFAIHKNNESLAINDTAYQYNELRVATANQTPSPVTPKFTFGEWYTRETRQRTRKLKLAESTQLVVASIGDSWTHNRDRWSGTTAQSLITELGDAGGGWTGFGFHPTVTALVNGNVRSTYTYSRSGTWTSTYGTSPSPDICHITSSTAGDKITCATPASPDISSCTLFFVGTADGVVRYRWNGGSWTSINVQGTVGNLGTVALTGFTTGAQTLEIEIVSGTCSLCGVNWKSTSSGVAWHKLGATGSQAAQWAAVNSTKWQTGLQALAPNLVAIMHGTNDQGANRTATQFATDISTIIDRVKTALPLADIFVIMPCENGRSNSVAMSAYSSAVYDVCVAKKVAFLDLQYVFGESFSEYASTSPRNWFNADLIHPEPTTGGRAITDAVMRFLLD